MPPDPLSLMDSWAEAVEILRSVTHHTRRLVAAIDAERRLRHGSVSESEVGVLSQESDTRWNASAEAKRALARASAFLSKEG